MSKSILASRLDSAAQILARAQRALAEESNDPFRVLEDAAKELYGGWGIDVGEMGALREACSGLSLSTASYILTLARDFALKLDVAALESELLRQGSAGVLRKTRLECAQIVAGGCMGVVTGSARTHETGLDGSHAWFPDFTFSMLWNQWRGSFCGTQYLKCIFAYFEALSEETNDQHLNESIEIERKIRPENGNTIDLWLSSTRPLIPLDMAEKAATGQHARIEDFPQALQVDFANKMLGGAILKGYGSQEENTFACSPELMVAMFFCEEMNSEEAIEVRGAVQYCHSHVNAQTRAFSFGGLRLDRTPHTIVAIDAVNYNAHGELSHWQQYETNQILRDMWKAHVGFTRLSGSADLTDGSVATGNWGCGCFRADPQLKLLIQWIAASMSRRTRIIYCAFGEASVTGPEARQAIERLQSEKLTVGDVALVLLDEKQYVQEPDTLQYILKRCCIGNKRELASPASLPQHRCQRSREE